MTYIGVMLIMVGFAVTGGAIERGDSLFGVPQTAGFQKKWIQGLSVPETSRFESKAVHKNAELAEILHQESLRHKRMTEVRQFYEKEIDQDE